MSATPLYKVIPACGGEPWSGEKVTRCPVAGACAPWVGEAVGAFALLKMGVTLAESVGVPSAAALDAMRVLQSETAAVDAAARRD